MRRFVSVVVLALGLSSVLGLLAPAAHADCRTPIGRYAFIDC